MEGNGFYKMAIIIIARNYGWFNQRLKAIEELAELQVELAKNVMHTEESKKRLVDEIADVMVMLDQIEFLTDTAEAVRERKEFKVRRQLERMELTE